VKAEGGRRTMALWMEAIGWAAEIGGEEPRGLLGNFYGLRRDRGAPGSRSIPKRKGSF
jgi:hypothetical protein